MFIYKFFLSDEDMSYIIIIIIIFIIILMNIFTHIFSYYCKNTFKIVNLKFNKIFLRHMLKIKDKEKV